MVPAGGVKSGPGTASAVKAPAQAKASGRKAWNGNDLLPILSLQGPQRVRVAERGQLALGDELLFQHRLFGVLRAFLHERLDRFVALVLAIAQSDHLVLLGQTLLTFGFRFIELRDHGFAIVRGASRNRCDKGNEKRNATKEVSGHCWLSSNNIAGHDAIARRRRA